MHAVGKNDIRPAAVADLFYPGNPVELDYELEKLIDDAKSIDLDGDIEALVCPHAGYQYSGPVAAAAYKNLKNHKYSVIAIISPSHRETFTGVSVFNGGAYETPLGLVPVASEYADALIEQDEVIVSSWAGHCDEHALEVQLPFLQKVLEETPIIPIVLGQQDSGTCKLLGEALGNVLKESASLIVASSDLSHHHPYDEAVKIDHATIQLIESFDEANFGSALEDQTSEACGGGAIIAAMVASKIEGADTVKSLLYKNSGDTSGDRSAVVGYLSAAFYKVN